MDCPSCKKVVFSGDRFCRHCGAGLPAVAAAGPGEDLLKTFRGALDGTVTALDRAWKRAEPDLQRASRDTQRAAANVWNDAKPHVDRAVKAFDDALKGVSQSKPVTKARETTAPVVDKASKTARSAADRAKSAAKPVVANVAEAVERGARKVKDRTRRPPEE